MENEDPGDSGGETGRPSSTGVCSVRFNESSARQPTDMVLVQSLKVRVRLGFGVEGGRVGLVR
jgi:hypothetical protein